MFLLTISYKYIIIIQLLSGIEAGVALVLMFNPLWVLKTRLALQDSLEINNHQKKYNGMMGT